MKAVILHNIRSLHNVGSIFRTADGAGFKKIYLCGITPEPVDRFGRLRPEFAKVALGAEKYIEWQKYVRTGALINRLKTGGYNVYALEQDRRAVRLGQWPRPTARTKVALVIGSEVDGLSKDVLDRVDRILEIPMYGGKESLNVAVAFGVAAYGLRATWQILFQIRTI